MITFAVLYLASFLVLAHVLAPKDYSWVRKTVSSLAAQKYPRKTLLQAGFIGFGTIFLSSILVDRPFRDATIFASAALYTFAGCMIAVGVFCTRPMGDAEYSRTEARLHNAFSVLAGVSLFAGVVAFAWTARSRGVSVFHGATAALFAPVGIGFFVFRPVRGIFLRALYAIGFAWLLLVDRGLVSV